MPKPEPTRIRHRWSLTHWPEAVFPTHSARGRYIVRTNRRNLMEAGALVRVGRSLVILGPQYHGWLARQSNRVAGYTVRATAARQRETEAA
jgi:hypothetical protein